MWSALGVTMGRAITLLVGDEACQAARCGRLLLPPGPGSLVMQGTLNWVWCSAAVGGFGMWCAQWGYGVLSLGVVWCGRG